MYHDEVDLHGSGPSEHEVYPVETKSKHDYWTSVTDVPCPVPGCKQTVVWYEAGFVPGYRVCMADAGQPGSYDIGSICHHFMARGSARKPELVRDHEAE